jgi:ABC-type transporter Mla maintaining outer membrane lipid asymmetry ATPase subunit MlaF
LEQGIIVAEGTPDHIQNSKNVWVQNFITGRSSDLDTSGSRLGIPVVNLE